MPTRAQHMISKSTRAMEFAWVRSGFEARVREGEVGAAQRLFAFHEYTAEHSGDWVLAQPWMEDGTSAEHPEASPVTLRRAGGSTPPP